MLTPISRVLELARGQAWSIEPEKLHAILAVLELRAAGHAAPADFQAAKPRQASAAGSIAVLPVFGVLSARANMVSDFSGGTSLEVLGAQLDQAAADPNVSAIVLDVDSPGGSVQGTPEAAAKIRAAMEKKRVVAVANHEAASAAYWLASQAHELVVTPSGDVGSIGVIAAHLDASEAEAKEGLRYSLVSAGRFKTELSQHEPLSSEARDALQARVNAYYDQFVRAVSTGRNVALKAVRDGFGEGRMVAADEAVALGMADRVDTLEGTLARLGARLARQGGATRAVLERKQALLEREAGQGGR